MRRVRRCVPTSAPCSPCCPSARRGGLPPTLACPLGEGVEVHGLPAEHEAVHGQLDGRLNLQFLIGKDVPPGSAVFSVAATATDLAIDRIVGKEGLTDGTVKLDVDPRAGLRAKGEGRLFGAPTSIELHRPKTGPGDCGLVRKETALPYSISNVDGYFPGIRLLV